MTIIINLPAYKYSKLYLALATVEVCNKKLLKLIL